MQKSTAEYIARAKAALGDSRMSDRELGEKLGGYAQQTVAKGKHGNMSDPLAMAIAEILNKAGDRIDAGEILLVARAERENDERVKSALLAYAKKVLSSVPANAARAVGALAVALGMLLPAHDLRAADVGGAGRF